MHLNTDLEQFQECKRIEGSFHVNYGLQIHFACLTKDRSMNAMSDHQW